LKELTILKESVAKLDKEEELKENEMKELHQ